MTITKIKLQSFTAFNNLEIQPSPGINVLIGVNGTGKTHLMKAAYAACDISKTQVEFAEKLTRVFLPSRYDLGRLINRNQFRDWGAVEIHRDSMRLRISIANFITVTGTKKWTSAPIESIYIPAEFQSFCFQRSVHSDEICADILDRAYRPVSRDTKDQAREKLLADLQELIGGRVVIKNQALFLKNRQGSLEFTLLSEGMRKLGLLWLLIKNGTLSNGSVLFWDTPETGFNPKLLGSLVRILLRLQRMGVQIFLATHNYAIPKEIYRLKKSEDKILFHFLYNNKRKGKIQCHSTSKYL